MQEKDGSIFIGSITGKGDPLTVDLKPKDRTITFKIDTDADMTVIPDLIQCDVHRCETNS